MTDAILGEFDLERLFLVNYDYQTDSSKRRSLLMTAVDECAITDVIGVIKQVLLYVRIQTEELKSVRARNRFAPQVQVQLGTGFLH